MTYWILLFNTVVTILNIVFLTLFALEYRPAIGKVLRRWFFLFFINALCTGAALVSMFLIRVEAPGILFRFVSTLRETMVLFNVFLIPYFIHASFRERYARYADISAAVLCIVAETFLRIGLSRLAGWFILAAVVYAVVLGTIILVSPRYKSLPERAQLKLLLIVTFCIVPGIAFDIVHGFYLFDAVWLPKIPVEIMPIYFILAAPLLLYRYRHHRTTSSGEVPVFTELSEREQEVVAFLINGSSNREISEALCIAESTVKKHANSIFRKLGVSSRRQLMKIRSTHISD